MTEEKRSCSFCGKSEHEVKNLIEGENAFILCFQDAAHPDALDLWAEDPPLRDAAARADDRGVRPRPAAPGDG